MAVITQVVEAAVLLATPTVTSVVMVTVLPVRVAGPHGVGDAPDPGGRSSASGCDTGSAGGAAYLESGVGTSPARAFCVARRGRVTGRPTLGSLQTPEGQGWEAGRVLSLPAQGD